MRTLLVGSVLALSFQTGSYEALSQGVGDPLPAPEVLLRRSIAYHDPEGVLLSSTLHVTASESRVDGTSRTSTATIEYRHDRFELARTMRDGTRIALRSEDESVEALLDGSARFSQEDADRYRITPDRVRWWHDIYQYLYGLPMKLEDTGTRLSAITKRVRFVGRDTYEIKVTYDPDVGNETWYFYFDPSDASLQGYRFYYDETKNDGEYVVLDGEIETDGVRFPKQREWYLNRDDSYYGTDIVESLRFLAR